MRNFEHLNKDAIAARLSGRRPVDTGVLQQRNSAPGKGFGCLTTSPAVANLVKGGRVRIDVWDVPWCANNQSFELAMQLAYMLNRCVPVYPQHTL